MNVTRYLDRLCAEGFFGDVTIRFQRGKVMILEERKTIRPEELSAR